MQYGIHNTAVISSEWKCCPFVYLLALGLHDVKMWPCFLMDFDVYYSYLPLCWEQICCASWDFGIVTISFLLLFVLRLLSTIKKYINFYNSPYINLCVTYKSTNNVVEFMDPKEAISFICFFCLCKMTVFILEVGGLFDVTWSVVHTFWSSPLIARFP